MFGFSHKGCPFSMSRGFCGISNNSNQRTKIMSCTFNTFSGCRMSRQTPRKVIHLFNVRTPVEQLNISPLVDLVWWRLFLLEFLKHTRLKSSLKVHFECWGHVVANNVPSFNWTLWYHQFNIIWAISRTGYLDIYGISIGYRVLLGKGYFDWKHRADVIFFKDEAARMRNWLRIDGSLSSNITKCHIFRPWHHQGSQHTTHSLLAHHRETSKYENFSRNYSP